jgi:hypothetical protein
MANCGNLGGCAERAVVAGFSEYNLSAKLNKYSDFADKKE